MKPSTPHLSNWEKWKSIGINPNSNRRLLFQSQMSPRGNQRNFSSPSLVKRSGLQHLKPVTTSQDKPPSGYSHNIWENPFGTLDPLGPHHQGHPPNHPQDLQYIHHHQFPHIPNHRLQSLEELTGQGITHFIWFGICQNWFLCQVTRGWRSMRTRVSITRQWGSSGSQIVTGRG